MLIKNLSGVVVAKSVGVVDIVAVQEAVGEAVVLVPESADEKAGIVAAAQVELGVSPALLLSDLALRVDFLQAKLNKLLVSISMAGDASKVVDDLDLDIFEAEEDEREKDDGVVVARERGADYDLLRKGVKDRRVKGLDVEDGERVKWES